MTTIARTASAAALSLAVFLSIPAAWSAGKISPAQQEYQKERAICLSGKSHQDKATCLKEAGAAYQEARRNGLASPGDTQLSSNATQRCLNQPEADRAACAERVNGMGSEGSVKGGGIIRQTETPVKP